jgi:AcrR family transcriptional regulator
MRPTSRSPALLSARADVPDASARDRLLAAAYDLFSRQGIRAVGIDAIIERSGVAKMTLYRHFKSKEDLVLAFLEQREALWSGAWLRAEVERRARAPRDRLRAIFDVFGDWFKLDSFEGCSFVNVLLENPDRESAVHRATVRHLERIREFVAELAAAAGITDPQAFARKWHILMKGSIVAAAEGDADAAARAREIGELVLAAAAGPGTEPR